MSLSIFNSSPTVENLREMFNTSKSKYCEMENALNMLHSKLDSDLLRNNSSKLDQTLISGKPATLAENTNASNFITRIQAECQNAEIKLLALELFMDIFIVKDCECRLLNRHDKAGNIVQLTREFYKNLARLPSEHIEECHIENLLKSLADELDQYRRTLSLEVYSYKLMA